MADGSEIDITVKTKEEDREIVPVSLEKSAKSDPGIKIVDDSDSDSEEGTVGTVSSVSSMQPPVLPKKKHKKRNDEHKINHSFAEFANMRKAREVPDFSEEDEDSEESDFDEDSVSSLGTMISRKEENQEEKKQDLLIKLQMLESRGVVLSKKFSMKSDLTELRLEFARQTKALETEQGVKTFGKMLMACVSGIEWLNGRFDPVGAQLTGWSESVMENLNDYDTVFAKLHEKYSESVDVSPELELMFMLGGSGFMFHLTNSLFKSAMPNMGDVLKENPNLMASVMNAANKTGGMTGGASSQPKSTGQSQDLRSPSMDVGEILGQNIMGGGQLGGKPQGQRQENIQGFANAMRNPPPLPKSARMTDPPIRMPPPQSIEKADTESIVSGSTVSAGSDTRSISISVESPRGRRGKRGGSTISFG